MTLRMFGDSFVIDVDEIVCLSFDSTVSPRGFEVHFRGGETVRFSDGAWANRVWISRDAFEEFHAWAVQQYKPEVATLHIKGLVAGPEGLVSPDQMHRSRVPTGKESE